MVLVGGNDELAMSPFWGIASWAFWPIVHRGTLSLDRGSFLWSLLPAHRFPICRVSANSQQQELDIGITW